MTAKRADVVKVKEITPNLQYVVPGLFGDYSSLSVGVQLKADIPEDMTAQEAYDHLIGMSTAMVQDSVNQVAEAMDIKQVFANG